jgi:hypothetical protein
VREMNWRESEGEMNWVEDINKKKTSKNKKLGLIIRALLCTTGERNVRCVRLLQIIILLVLVGKRIKK